MSAADGIFRVFPRRTQATPRDSWCQVGEPSLFDVTLPGIREVHISVAFTWDLPLAQRLAEAWQKVAPVKIGGPATGMAGGDFEPGRYLKPGYVITSRGCPNRCWFCSVWRREGQVRELPITTGWNVLDDNLLACSDRHIRGVFDMLQQQKAQGHKIEFTGGLEAARLQPWHVDYLTALKPKQIFFAYDTPDDLAPLRMAGQMLLNAGFTTASHTLRCYVLIGYHKDTFTAAEQRLHDTLAAGFLPMAMLWRAERGQASADWRALQRAWARPALIAARTQQRTGAGSWPGAQLDFWARSEDRSDI